MKAIVERAALVFALVLASSAAHAETENECKVRLMETTKLIAVQGDAVANFTPDSDPDSLEIVFLTKPEQGKSRISDDGQVIYLNDATDKEQQDLTMQVFDIRVKQGFCSKPVSK